MSARLAWKRAGGAYTATTDRATLKVREGGALFGSTMWTWDLRIDDVPMGGGGCWCLADAKRAATRALERQLARKDVDAELGR